MNNYFRSIPDPNFKGKAGEIVKREHYDQKVDMTLATDGRILVGLGGKYGEPSEPSLLKKIWKAVPKRSQKARFCVNPQLLILALNSLRDGNGVLPPSVGLDFPTDRKEEPMTIREPHSRNFALVMGIDDKGYNYEALPPKKG